jgi:hypothetical protein
VSLCFPSRTCAVDTIAANASLDTSQGQGDFRPEPARKVSNSISWEPAKRHSFAPSSEPEAFIGNLCEVYEIKCAARGGHELCPGFRKYDPEIMEAEKRVRLSDCLVHLCMRPQANATHTQLQAMKLFRHLVSVHPRLVHLGHPSITTFAGDSSNNHQQWGSKVEA